VRSVPVVEMEPGSQGGQASAGVIVAGMVGPLPHRGLDEALGLAVGPWRIGPGEDVFEAELGSGPGKGVGDEAGPVMIDFTAMPRPA